MRKLNGAAAIPGGYQDRALRAGNPVQRFWHRSKLLLIQRMLNPQPEDRILDLGCGSGVCAGFMGVSGASVLGLDANPNAIAFARGAYGGANVEFQLHGADEPLPGTFTKAVCLDVAEHLYVEQFRAALENLHGAIEPGGLLLITTPNHKSLWPLIELGLHAFHAVSSVEGGSHVSRYNHRDLREACERAGFQPVRERSICTVGPWLAPFSQRLAEAATFWEIDQPVPGGAVLAHLYRNGLYRTKTIGDS